MCRHLAYLGPPISLRDLIIEPPHGLYRQAWAPRRQRHGTVNADGFGVGWYASGDPLPARYRRAQPIWADPSFADVARVTMTTGALAAVRCATTGMEAGEAAAAPYAAGRWLFSHNGAVSGWPAAAAGLTAALPAADLLTLEARCDSALLWAIVLDRLRVGADPARALAATVNLLQAERVPGRFNFLVTDGEVIAATAAGDTLCYRRGDGHVLVASEPCDDAPGWTWVPDGSVLTAAVGAVDVSPIVMEGKVATQMTAVEIVRLLPPGFLTESLRGDALAGLTRSPKQLPPKWFYDDTGSKLFEQITRLPEYYPTRAEREILRAHAREIASASCADTLVELGSGSAEKTVLLLDALRARGTLRRYVPVDVSEAALFAAGRRVRAAYPGLNVLAVVSDFEEHLGLPAADGRRLVAFLGGTIGNLEPAERAEFLASLRAGLHGGDTVLLGTDLVKDPATLVAAYDDAAGVTAAFNKNVLSVLNRELDADFDLEAFEHVAVWDSVNEWIEMRLRSLAEQRVKLGVLGMDVAFTRGEEMRTEVSAKFREEGVRAELSRAGFETQAWWTDAKGRFALSLSLAM